MLSARCVICAQAWLATATLCFKSAAPVAMFVHAYADTSKNSEFSGDRDHAMCDIQNRTVLVAQITKFQKLSFTLSFAGVLNSAIVMPIVWVRSGSTGNTCAWLKPVAFSRSCSRCLLSSPLPCPTLPKLSTMVCGFRVKGVLVVHVVTSTK
jgi:hypothetical protein